MHTSAQHAHTHTLLIKLLHTHTPIHNGTRKHSPLRNMCNPCSCMSVTVECIRQLRRPATHCRLIIWALVSGELMSSPIPIEVCAPRLHQRVQHIRHCKQPLCLRMCIYASMSMYIYINTVFCTKEQELKLPIPKEEYRTGLIGELFGIRGLC